MLLVLFKGIGWVFGSDVNSEFSIVGKLGIQYGYS